MIEDNEPMIELFEADKDAPSGSLENEGLLSKDILIIESFETYFKDTQMTAEKIHDDIGAFPELFSSKNIPGDDVKSQQNIFSATPLSVKLYANLLTAAIRQKQKQKK